jgi:3-oxoacyl-[acyl-carrier protein] reductase
VKVALVTGGARGLGRAYAGRLARAGFRVAVLDRDLRSWAEFPAEPQCMVSEEIEGVLEIEVDCSDRPAVEQAIAQVVGAWGRIDVLVANAGGAIGTPAETRASELDPELLHAVTANNLYATVHTVAAVAPVMKAQGSGKIVTVASAAASHVAPKGTLAHYAAAKAAILNYTRFLAQDLGPYGITANCLAPGVTATGRIAATIVKGNEERLVESIALRRVAQVEDLAKVVEFLASDLSDYVTGALIPVDGGLRG